VSRQGDWHIRLVQSGIISIEGVQVEKWKKWNKWNRWNKWKK